MGIEPHSSIDATPDKRLYWSIISDYELLTGICELIDNAIDLWTRGGRKRKLQVSVHVDPDQQALRIQDNAGGVPENQLGLLVTPGGSLNDPLGRSIGIFGVGSKRACVALGQRTSIQTRYRNKQTYMVEVNDAWLNESTWELPTYQTQDIAQGTTKIEISLLRRPLQIEDVERLRAHLAATYCKFLAADFSITLNGATVDPTTFDRWAYPPSMLPSEYEFEVDLEELGSLRVRLQAGLILDRDPEAQNYGVYIFCNDRLVVKELRERAVGYLVSSEAGRPHPDASLCRVLVSFEGAAKAMPWNSAKNGVNYSHLAFRAAQKRIVELVSHYTKASRRWKNDWDGEVFAYEEGAVLRQKLTNADSGNLRLPPAPAGQKQYATSILGLNAGLLKKQPWARGLVEAMAASRLLSSTRFSTKNRFALILLDSNLEISFKEYLVNNRGKFSPKKYNDEFIKNLLQNRSDVISHVNLHLLGKGKITADELRLCEYYYQKRNKIIHERATVDITNEDVEIYRAVVESVLKKLYGVRFPSV